MKRKFTLGSEQNDWGLKLLLWEGASSLVSDNFTSASLLSVPPADSMIQSSVLKILKCEVQSQ